MGGHAKNMRYEIIKGNVKLSKLGLGAMRLPQTEPGFAGPIDESKAQEVIDYCMTHGVNYYDTAYIYHGGKSRLQSPVLGTGEPAPNRIYRLLFAAWNNRLNSQRLQGLRLYPLFSRTEAHRQNQIFRIFIPRYTGLSAGTAQI